MYEDFAPKLARILTEYCVPIQEKELVIIQAPMTAEPLIEALYEAALKRGAYPEIHTGTRNSAELFYKYANDDQLSFVSPISKAIVENQHVLFAIRSPINTKRLTRVDPERLAITQRAGRPLSDIFREREAAGDLRWNITAWPSYAAAQDAEMGFIDYTEFIYKAAGLDQDDPVAYWQAFRDRQMRLVEWLAGKNHVEVRGPGINMSLEFGGRNWVSCHGDRNFPDGEIYTSPLDDSVNGTVEFNFPSIYGGREIDGVKLRFQDGLVVDASASKGQDYLYSQLDADEGSRRLGEFAIGTNMGIQEFTREILFDEKIGGTIHMALGLALTPAGGTNKSVVHWDMVHNMKDGGEIFIDGELFYQSGKFLLDEQLTGN